MHGGTGAGQSWTPDELHEDGADVHSGALKPASKPARHAGCPAATLLRGPLAVARSGLSVQDVGLAQIGQGSRDAH